MKQIIILCLAIGLGNSMFGQCFPDRHSTNWFDGWLSCNPSENPNSDRGATHWILYDYGEVFNLGPSQLWNANDPSNLSNGMRDIIIDYSLDGVEWTSAGNYTLEIANGHPTYEGHSGPDLTGIQARFLLITAVNNWGGSCYGFSELKVEAEKLPVSVKDAGDISCLDVTVFPNPYSSNGVVEIQSQCGEDISYLLVDVLGRVHKHDIINGNSSGRLLLDDVIDFPGVYFLQFRQGSSSKRFTITKIDQ
jgi:hypothetical protein